jgi:hypothetical protein
MALCRNAGSCLKAEHSSTAGLRLIHTYHTVPMPRQCRSPAMPCRYGFRLCLSHLIYTVRPCLIQTCHAATKPRPCLARAIPRPWCYESDFSRRRHSAGSARNGHGMARVNCIGMPETVCGRPARVRLLPATTMSSTSSTKVFISSIPIR